MSDFKYFTRSNSSPQGKPRVYLTAHPGDHALYFETIREEILSRQNCAVFYLEPDTDPAEVEDYELKLSQMQLFVVPVTTRLLTTPNWTMDSEVPFALSHHIPVLPLMQEGGLDELFNRRFGDLQYLDKSNTDPTAIPYDEKLTKYLNSVIVGDELAAKVRAAFNAYIFLSYRKKDRRYAQELMKLIHSNPQCRDIAIWYDEFLTPGENFNDAIRAALEKSDLFALAVTPNLINEINYILTTEYPAARELEKDILPAEMLPTDRARLSEMYEGLPEPVKAGDGEALSERLMSLIRRLALTFNDSDPQHNFFIGLAYLSGIDVEVDHKRAVELITGSAEEDCAEAIEKLVSMYETGEGVQRDYHKAVEWRERHIAVLRQEYETDPTEDRALALMLTISACAGVYYDLLLYNEAVNKFRELSECCSKFLSKYRLETFLRGLAYSYNMRGRIMRTFGNTRRAEEFFLAELKLCEILSEGEINIDIQRDYILCYNNLGDLANENSDIDKAEDYYRRSLEISLKLAKETGSILVRRDLYITYSKIGSILIMRSEFEKAEEYFKKGLEICRALYDESKESIDLRNLAVFYEKLGEIAVERNDYDRAEDYYLRSMDIGEYLLETESTIKSQKDLLNIYHTLGNIAREKGNFLKSKEYLLKALTIAKEVARIAKTEEALHDLFLVLISIGDNAKEAELWEEAEDYYRRGKVICEAMSKIDNSVKIRGELIICYCSLGDTSKARRRTQEAEEYYLKALRLSEETAKETGTRNSYHDIAVIHCKLGELLSDVNHLSEARRIWKELKMQFPKVNIYRQGYDYAVYLISNLNR